MLINKGKFFTIALFLLFTQSLCVADISILSGLTYEYSADGGESYTGTIVIRNNSTEAVEVKFYQTDYNFFYDGRSFYDEAGSMQRSNAGWINFTPHRVVIPDGITTTLNFIVQVPANDTLGGTFWSMLMIEEIPKQSAESSQKEMEDYNLGVFQIIRYGVQIVTHIGNTGEGILEFLQAKLVNENNKRLLQIDTQNNGTRWFKPILWVELYNSQGNYIGKFEGGQFRLFPGTSVRFRIDLTNVPIGNYKALAVADCGGENVIGINYTLKFIE